MVACWTQNRHRSRHCRLRHHHKRCRGIREACEPKISVPVRKRKSRKLNWALCRNKKGSKNRDKARLVLAKKYEKIANQRKHFLQCFPTKKSRTKTKSSWSKRWVAATWWRTTNLRKRLGMSVGSNSAGNWHTKPNGKDGCSSRRTDSIRPAKSVPPADIGTARKPHISAIGRVRTAALITIGTSTRKTSWLWPSKRKHMRQVLPFEPAHIHSRCLQRHTQARKEFAGSSHFKRKIHKD